MKNITKLFFAAAFLTAGMASAQTGGVGVGTTNPDASSALDVTSTTKGFLMPRMTTTERTAITSPATGLQVYDTDTNTQWYYNGTVWVNAATAGQKWVDGANPGDIILNSSTSNIADIKVSNNTFSIIDKTPLTESSFNAGVFTSLPVNYVNPYFSSIIASKSIPVIHAASNSKTLNKQSLILTSDEPQNTTMTYLSSDISTTVSSDNTNGYSVIRGISSSANHNGTGVLGSIQGGFIGASIQGTGTTRANFLTGLVTQVALNSITLTNVAIGIESRANVRSSGNADVLSSIDAKLSNGGSGISSSNITNAYSYRSLPTFNASYTGTITNYYDFYAQNITASNGTISNKYGIYIDGTDKTNYLGGKLNIGGGTTTSTAKLNIFGAGDGTKLLYFGTERPWQLIQNGAGAAASLSLQTVNNDKAFQFLSPSGTITASFIPSDNVSQKVILVPTIGNVGVGTSLPLAKFHVNETLAGGLTTPLILSNLSTVANSEVELRFGATSGPGIRYSAISAINNGSDVIDLKFTTGASTVITEKMRITGGGNVGIGVTAPIEKLEVNGAIKVGTTTTAAPTAGTIRFNSTTSKFEGYDGAAWVAFH